MATIADCAVAAGRLCAAFGRRPTGALVAEYHTVFNSLSPDQLSALIGWAIETLEVPFPPIATLRRHAVDEGWFGRKRPDGDSGWLEVECPECGGSFMIRRKTLLVDAQNHVIYECPNRRHWKCTELFRAQDLSQNIM